MNNEKNGLGDLSSHIKNKDNCPDCKDLPEGEVTVGHDHRVAGIEEQKINADESVNYVDNRTEEEKKVGNDTETVVTTSNDEVVEEENKVVEEVAEEPQEGNIFGGDVVEITGERARELRSVFDRMHRTHRGEIIIGSVKIVCKG